jgi:hypothetical protein
MTPNNEAPECLESYGDSEHCEGNVEYRMALGGTVSYPRCNFHWNKRLDFNDRVTRHYPDSPIAPSWFDPSYAGEQWDDDY